MEYSGTWREIWTQKGQMEGGIEDLYIYDGWEKSKGDICQRLCRSNPATGSWRWAAVRGHWRSI